VFVVSGCEVESKLQRLLISLSNFIDRFIKKPEPEVKEEEFNLGGKPVGFFMNQVKAPLEYYVDSIFDEEADYYIRVQYMCACGEPVFRSLSNDFGFGCDHCDSICQGEETCEECYNLFSVDFGDPNASI
jgi:hypothetical protein